MFRELDLGADSATTGIPTCTDLPSSHRGGYSPKENKQEEWGQVGWTEGGNSRYRKERQTLSAAHPLSWECLCPVRLSRKELWLGSGATQWSRSSCWKTAGRRVVLPRGGTEVGPEFSSVKTQGPQLRKSGSAEQASGLQGGCCTRDHTAGHTCPKAPRLGGGGGRYLQRRGTERKDGDLG